MKVAVERRRRDRINRALESLRQILAEDTYTDVVNMTSDIPYTFCTAL